VLQLERRAVGTDVNVVAIIAAGGRGERFGPAIRKQLVPIAGVSLLQRSVDAFDSSPAIDRIIVVLPADLVTAQGVVRPGAKPLDIVAGGRRRQDSVANGFAAVPADADVVVVHDAARPFVSQALIARTVAAAAIHGAAIAALPARDTIKLGEPDGAATFVRSTLPRGSIFLAQTPQAFRRDTLRRAIELGHEEDATDESVLVERAGLPVYLIEGDPRNVKITTEEDLATARAFAGDHGAPQKLRAGTGYDLHRLVEGRRLLLGGVLIPFDRGLLGHSDADVLAHAVTDAILGAAAAGDIGRHFPDHDPRWKDASSLDLLRRALAVIRSKGFELENVDAVVIAERPVLGPHMTSIIASLAAAMRIDASRVSVKAKTNEGVGAIGRGEAIAVHAVAMLSEKG
jgi:2-C-methyl-D-erythritol 4-phosphate cytidylyltransferase/2-C-methyl-D-erythritol 2,4-cyclodiphosphate synthase